MELTDSALITALDAALDMLNYGVGGAGYATEMRSILSTIKKSGDFKDRGFSLFSYSPKVKAEETDTTFTLWRLAVAGAVHVLKWHDRRENPCRSTAFNSTPPDINELVDYYQGLRDY